MKSNIEYLREDIAKAEFMPVAFKNQLYEWIDAIEGELKELTDDFKILRLDSADEIAMLKTTIEEKQEEINSFPILKEIDCGIGLIHYTTDNLKLQCLMDDFKEQHERSKQTLQLFQ